MRALALLLCFVAGATHAQGVLLSRAAAASPTRDDVAERYAASATDGVAFGCDAQIQSCLKAGPGANTGIGTDGSGRLLLGTGAGSATVCIDDECNAYFTGNGNWVNNNGSGAVILNNNTGIYNQTSGKALFLDAAFGVGISKKALGTCAAAYESPTSIISDVAAGGTTGALTRLCFCASDGAGTPAYTWRNLGCPNTAGTATTCPVCP